MESALIQGALTLGIGGFFAYVIMNWKRADDIAYAKRLEELLAAEIARAEDLKAIIKANTDAFGLVAKELQSLNLIESLEKRIETKIKKLNAKK